MWAMPMKTLTLLMPLKYDFLAFLTMAPEKRSCFDLMVFFLCLRYVLTRVCNLSKRYEFIR
jgi:hypothetical protein